MRTHAIDEFSSVRRLLPTHTHSIRDRSKWVWWIIQWHKLCASPANVISCITYLHRFWIRWNLLVCKCRTESKSGMSALQERIKCMLFTTITWFRWIKLFERKPISAIHSKLSIESLDVVVVAQMNERIVRPFLFGRQTDCNVSSIVRMRRSVVCCRTHELFISREEGVRETKKAHCDTNKANSQQKMKWSS